MNGDASALHLPFASPLEHLTALLRVILKAPGLADPEPTAAIPIEVARVQRAVPSQRVGRRRAWRAIPITEENKAEIEALAKVVAAVADSSFVKLERMSQGTVIGEDTMICTLAVPILDQLGWSINRNYRFPDGSRPDGFVSPVAFEFKRPDMLYDNIDARNSHSSYKTVADQILKYLRQENIACVIYSNGRFWWRIERDEEADGLFAMRFNMHNAVNDWRNKVTFARKVNRMDALRSPLVQRFVQTFGAAAFAPTSYTTLDVHVGMPQMMGDIGVVWLKDLNQGFG